jgi:surface protein
MFKKLLFTLMLALSGHLVQAQNEFITTWKPGNVQNPVPVNPPFASSNTQAWAPFQGTNYTIHWEEVGYPAHQATLTGVTSVYQVLLDFGTPLNPNPADATYTVKVSNGSGNFHRIYFRDPVTLTGTIDVTGDSSKIIAVNQWGNTKWSSMQYAFTGCNKLDLLATDIPDLSEVTNMSYMFMGCSSLSGNPSINDWNTSNVTDFTGLFNACMIFNQPIGNWNTGNVTTMAVMFLMARNFNQPIGNWNTGKVTEMTAMFNNATVFNQPIGNWNVSKVMDMEFMFSNASKFNQPIGNWNTSKVVEMDNMFLNAKLFNQDISNWNTSEVVYMDGMFSGAEQFNQNLGSWNTSKAIYMNSMFTNAKAFNQDIGGWNTSNVILMDGMFANATVFNQNLGSWNLGSLTTASNMFGNSGLNCQNYDRTLVGWSQNSATPNNIFLSPVAPLVYAHPAAVNARNYLITSKNWNISGDIYDKECQSFLGVSNIKHENNTGIYPNPATDFIFVKNSEAKKFTIIDQSGRKVSKGMLDDGKIDARDLVPGNYILQLSSDKSIQNLKFIKK